MEPWVVATNQEDSSRFFPQNMRESRVFGIQLDARTAAAPTLPRLRGVQSRVLLQLKAARRLGTRRSSTPKNVLPAAATRGTEGTGRSSSPLIVKSAEGGKQAKLLPLPLRMPARAHLPSPHGKPEVLLGHAPEPGVFCPESSENDAASLQAGAKEGSKKRPPALGMLRSLAAPPATPASPASPHSPISRRTRKGWCSTTPSPEAVSPSEQATRVRVGHTVQPYNPSKVKALLSPTRSKTTTPKSGLGKRTPKHIGRLAPTSPSRGWTGGLASVSFTRPKNLPIRVEKRYMPGVGMQRVRVQGHKAVSLVREGDRPACLLQPVDDQKPMVSRRRSEADEEWQAELEREAMARASSVETTKRSSSATV
uniref:Uncharacterized protein n=1 Tax=Hemiselmis andersenii TaxID=464988 RepID=A0A6U4L2T1_HEMAN|mmetsp:Transcript_4941/g.11522  ORF Transcript_4941/g.11522 Transcript_4941/m.11522 type:complete len:367 (-) Transcript_4941:172-1272(-)